MRSTLSVCLHHETRGSRCVSVTGPHKTSGSLKGPERHTTHEDDSLHLTILFPLTLTPPLPVSQIWNFSTGKLRAIIKVKSPVTHMELHRGNNLAALATADFIVRLFDVETRRVVRIFQGHGGRVTDLVRMYREVNSFRPRLVAHIADSLFVCLVSRPPSPTQQFKGMVAGCSLARDVQYGRRGSHFWYVRRFRTSL